MKYSLRLVLIVLGTVVGLADDGRCQSQMEKRQFSLYDFQLFAATKPMVGKEFPDLMVNDLTGKRVQLSEYRGKIIVLLKAGYT